MSTQEPHQNHASNELSSFPGDNRKRFEVFAPMLRNLYQNKVVYHERFTGIIKLENVQITLEGFRATAIPYLLIEKGNNFDQFFFKKTKWVFGATWSWMRLIGNSLSVPYANWSIWCEPERVKIVEHLVLEKKFKEALTLTRYEKF